MRRSRRRIHTLISLVVLMIIALVLSFFCDAGTAGREVCEAIGILSGIATVVLAIMFTIDNHDIKFIDDISSKENKKE